MSHPNQSSFTLDQPSFRSNGLERECQVNIEKLETIQKALLGYLSELKRKNQDENKKHS